MGGEKGVLTHLQQILRSLCFKTEWKYAVFWKLKQGERMIRTKNEEGESFKILLTWEEAYYDNHGPADDPSSHMPTDGTSEISYDGLYLPDPLGLAVEKMSHLVYSLGEGIIGQVAITGRHQWIFADKPSSYLSPSENCDGWQSQFSAGIRTTAIVAVVPHGVVQLGSLNMITEDMQLVNHIKDAFCSLQNASMEFIIPNLQQYSMQSCLYLSQVPPHHAGLEIVKFPPSSNKAISKNAQSLSHSLPSPGICNNLSSNVLQSHGVHQNNSFEVFSSHLGFESRKCGNDGSVKLHRPKSTTLNLKQQQKVQMNILNKGKNDEEDSSWGSDMFIDSKHDDVPTSCIFPAENTYSDLSTRHGKIDAVYDSAVLGSDKLDNTVYLRSKELELAEQLKMQLERGFEQKSEMEVSCNDSANSSLIYPAGFELYEALGIAFKKEQGNSAWNEPEKTALVQNGTPERMGNSHLITECGSKYPLEAVMGVAGSAFSNIKSENSLFTSTESLLSTGRTSETHKCAKQCSSLDEEACFHSSGTMEDGTHQHLKSTRKSTEIFFEKYSTESSLKILTNPHKESELKLEPTKVVRKRSRPQPKDRKMIRDRIKELRELIPNGSKCSINSLLERAIKHMLYLQSVTKGVDKIKKCAPSKFYDKKMDQIQSRSHDHGSSWVVEVGSETEACPIVIENLNVNGQMLIEMCEEGTHFLDIVEVLRSFDLAIIRGVTEVRGEKTWASFVVEGQDNRRINRMDILWALLPLLQPTTSIQ